MSKDLPTVASVAIPEQYDVTAQPGSDEPAEPLDWNCVLTVASARLIDSSIEHDTIDHMKTSGMADDFAAQLCVYGLAAEELVHMHQHIDADETEPCEPKASASAGA